MNKKHNNKNIFKKKKLSNKLFKNIKSTFSKFKEKILIISKIITDINNNLNEGLKSFFTSPIKPTKNKPKDKYKYSL